MKIVSILVAVLLVSVHSELVEFGEQAVNEIFKEKRNCFVLFSSSQDADAKQKFSQSAASDSTNVFTIVDREANADHFKRFSEYLGIDVASIPTLIYMVQARKKYIADPSDMSSQTLASFVEKVASGEIKAFLKSAPIPTEEKGAVRTIVGKNFKQAILESEKEVLLKVYAPWCGHCKQIAPEFEAAASALSSNPNVILADFDGTLNQVEEIQIQGYPTLLWYGKNKSDEPMKFNGGRDKTGIIDWIKDHTEYDWIDLSVPDNEEL